MVAPVSAAVHNAAWLEWVANLMGSSRQSYAATFPPDRYYCLLDELPIHLVPRGARAGLRSDANGIPPLVLNPNCLFSDGANLPPELLSLKDFTSVFALQGTTAWVRDAACGSVSPFWLGPRLEEAVRSLRQNEPVPATLPHRARVLLQQAGILITPAALPGSSCAVHDDVAQAADLFRKSGYAPLLGLIHPFHVAALRRYYRNLIRSGSISLGDGQSARRYVAHNEQVARYFHHQIASAVSKVVRERLKPSYVYLASYREGAELKKHTDREQCEYSVTLCLDFSPEPAHETCWPIRLETSTGEVTVYQALGDGLVYRGTRLPHYRDVLGKGHTSTSIFFHYVGADFKGSLD